MFTSIEMPKNIMDEIVATLKTYQEIRKIKDAHAEVIYGEPTEEDIAMRDAIRDELANTGLKK